jgi:hypothetical protein
MPPNRKNNEEDRLIVRYDGARKSVTILFQGQAHVLAGTYPTYDDGMIAGYSHARSQGWQLP